MSCTPFQGLPRGCTGRPPFVHNIQRRYGRRHVPLGNGGGRVGGGPVGPWVVDTAPGGIFLHQQWTDNFYNVILVPLLTSLTVST